jgi:bifunctional polynucleotide phosphatase/kinase
LEGGYDLVIVTNQKSAGQQRKNRLARIQYFYKLMGLPITIFASLADDEYRKPQVGIWDLITEIFGLPIEAFYVGDAAGEPLYYSDADIDFARNVRRKRKFGLAFYPAQEYFAQELPQLPKGQKLILMVGAPGAGKSTLAEQLVSREKNSIVLASDVVKTRLPTLTKKALREGRTVIVDATNGPKKKRDIYYAMAEENEVPVYVFWVVRDGLHANRMREHPVPEVAINTYFKYLEDPTEDTEPEAVYELDYWHLD